VKCWKRQAKLAPKVRPFRRRQYGGLVIETRTVARPGAQHVLILPQLGATAGTFSPHLLPLLEHASVTWVRLPKVQAITGRTGMYTDVAVFPVDPLVAALEAFRKEQKISRFVVLGEYAAGWIAMRFAQRHRRSCAGLILIDTPLDKPAFVGSLLHAAKRGTPGEKWTARLLMSPNAILLSPANADRIHARELASGYADAADLEIGWNFFRADQPGGFSEVPDIAWKEDQQLDLPALFIYSAASPFSGHRHAARIRQHFPQAMLVPFRKVRAMPYVKECAAFQKAVTSFLDARGE